MRFRDGKRGQLELGGCGTSETGRAVGKGKVAMELPVHIIGPGSRTDMDPMDAREQVWVRDRDAMRLEYYIEGTGRRKKSY